MHTAFDGGGGRISYLRREKEKGTTQQRTDAGQTKLKHRLLSYHRFDSQANFIPEKEECFHPSMALIRFISGIAVQYPRVYLKQIPSYILPKANSVVYGEGRIWPSNAFSDSCLHSLPPMSFVTWLYARKHPTRSPSQKSLRRRRINGRSAEFSLPSACSPAAAAAAASSSCLLQYATKDWYGGCSSKRDDDGS